jgi:hypothetical protein
MIFTLKIGGSEPRDLDDRKAEQSSYRIHAVAQMRDAGVGDRYRPLLDVPQQIGRCCVQSTREPQ